MNANQKIQWDHFHFQFSLSLPRNVADSMMGIQSVGDQFAIKTQISDAVCRFQIETATRGLPDVIVLLK